MAGVDEEGECWWLPSETLLGKFLMILSGLLRSFFVRVTLVVFGLVLNACLSVKFYTI